MTLVHLRPPLAGGTLEEYRALVPRDRPDHAASTGRACSSWARTFFLYSGSAAMVHGVGRDARRVAETIEARLRTLAAA